MARAIVKTHFQEETAYIKDAKPGGATGGTFTAGLWVTRDLTTLEGSYPWVSLSLNQFTLQPGVYEIEASAPAEEVNRHKIKLRNITTASDEVIGTSSFTIAGNISYLAGQINLLTTTTFEIQHRCQVTKTANGFGVETNVEVDEVYTTVKITKIG